MSKRWAIQCRMSNCGYDIHQRRRRVLHAHRLRTVQDAHHDLGRDGTALTTAGSLGVWMPAGGGSAEIDLPMVNARVTALARAQSADIGTRLAGEGIRLISGAGRLRDPAGCWLSRPTVARWSRSRRTSSCSPPVPGRGCSPAPYRTGGASSPGASSTTCSVAGAAGGHRVGGHRGEFANAYQALGSHVALVSSRDRVLPGEDSELIAGRPRVVG